MKLRISKGTIAIFVITGLALLLYTGFEIFWQLNPSLNVTSKPVTQVPASFDLETVDSIWKYKDLKEFTYLSPL